jgi:hypothetical protein
MLPGQRMVGRALLFLAESKMIYKPCRQYMV